MFSLFDPKTKEDLFNQDEYEEILCPTCDGSGEGIYSGTKCSRCNGKGVIYMDKDSEEIEE